MNSAQNGHTMRFRLRTLLIVLALGTMVLATAWQYREFFLEDRPSARKFYLPPDASLQAEANWQKQLERLNAEIEELRAKHDAELAKQLNLLQRRKDLELYELSLSNLMEAKPGIYFLGPELLPTVQHY